MDKRVLLALHALRRVGRRSALAICLSVLGLLCGFTLNSAGSGSLVSVNPLAGARLYVPPDTPAQAQVRAWSDLRPNDARLIQRIAQQPIAVWLGHSSVAGLMDETLHEAARQNALPVFVTYFLPHRDCGSYSAGGAETPGEYEHWIRWIAARIGSRRAAIIVEPDALSELGCWGPVLGGQQIALIRNSVGVFSRLPNTSVYIDAGNRPIGSKWISTMALRLKAVGIARVRGFAVNVSNYGSVTAEAAYGREIISALGGAWHFVIDTSRNGHGWAPGDPWCNPPGRGLGPVPTTSTGDPLVDAYLWIKLPGSSDGPCNGGPPAGVWWPQQALELAKNAVQQSSG